MDKVDYLSEKIERAALESMHACCPSDVKKNVGLDLVECEDGVAACSSEDTSILINRVLGLGTETKVSAESIEFIASLYQGKGIENYFVHIYEDTLSEGAKKLLDSKRFVKKRGWMKFRARDPKGKPAQTDLRVEKINPAQGEDFGKIVCPAFGMKDISVPVLASMANDDRWHLFVSYEGDTPAGAGGLFVDNKVGWLEWGATDPSFRSRGSQATIMAKRLELAEQLGCEYVFTETGEAVEGDPQHSYKNILKAGFEESVLRLNYAPNPD